MAAPVAKDPTKPPGQNIQIDSQTSTEANIRVTAIFSKSNQYAAIVNGAVVRTGDVIAGWQVIDVQPEFVAMTLGKSAQNSEVVRFRVSEKVNVKR